MTPQQALQLLDQATGLLTLNRQEHMKVMEALKVLNEAIKPKNEEKK